MRINPLPDFRFEWKRVGNCFRFLVSNLRKNYISRFHN